MIDDGYVPPTRLEVRALLSALGLTGAAAASLVDVDPRTVRRWTGGERQMPFAVLYTLLHRASGHECTPDAWRKQLHGLLDASLAAR